MVERFFSLKYAGQGEIFEGLDIWKEEKYRKLQGTYPVISISFAKIKDTDYSGMLYAISQVIFDEYTKHSYLLDGTTLNDTEKELFAAVKPGMPAREMWNSLNSLANYMSRYYGKKVIVLLDEYDTPMQEAYLNGFWGEAVAFTRQLFNATFKTNPYLERAIITGITRISKESMFSDLNNLKVVTTTSSQYATAFGFTEDEVFAAMDEYGLETKAEMKLWYDGFTLGDVTDIYNPWSVINVLRERTYDTYWVNSGANRLIGKVLRTADAEIKKSFETLLAGQSIECVIDEEIVYDQLDMDRDAIWSLMLASGYLKVVRVYEKGKEADADKIYELKLTNLEIRKMMRTMVKGWFAQTKTEYNDFLKALLLDDVEAMNDFMNDIALSCFSSFDTANNITGRDAPERFYHGFVLGLIVDLAGRFEIKSNRESGFGRYDVMLIPLDKNKDNAYVIEFKVKKRSEATLEDTLQNAHAQIEEKRYAQELISSGIPAENIREYGFAFEGKTVLIG
jgi:uncharacterized protein YqfB (UPF0267 family)